MLPRFPLQAVLDYRGNLVEALEIELSRLVAAHLKAKNALELLHESRINLSQELRGAQMGNLDLVRISHLRVNIEMVDVYIKRQEEEVERIAKQVEAKRNELIKARQDEEALVVLKDKMIEEFMNDLKLKESRFQDDIYIANYYQKMLREANQK